MKLNNGVDIPQIGIGTFMISPTDAEESVCNALVLGYRLIDTANAYVNERAVGRGIRKSGIPRKKIFLSTKLWVSEYENPNAVDETLERLGVDYIDLLFLHQPAGNYIAGYKLLEKAYKEGKIKSIGVSNFHGDALSEILKICEIKPQVYQGERHPYYTGKNIKDLLKREHIKVMSWYPLGHGDSNLINEPIFKELGVKYNKNPAQIILRWHVQMGFIVIPGSRNIEHIKDNLNIFDFELTEEEMNNIARLDKEKRYFVIDETSLKNYTYWSPTYESDVYDLDIKA